MSVLGALKLAGSVMSAVNSLIRMYGADTVRSPFLSDLYDFFKLSPSDFSITITSCHDDLTAINLALMQDFSFNLNKEVNLITSLEAPVYAAVSNGRVSGSGYISRIYTTPIVLIDKDSKIHELSENLLTIFSRWMTPEKVFDNGMIILIPYKGNEERVKKGLELYKKFDSDGLLSDLKSFAVGLVKSVVNKALSAINEVLPVMETISLLKDTEENEEEAGVIDCASLLKNNNNSFIQVVPTSYSFRSSAGSVAVFESIQFIITDANFPHS